MAHRIAPLLFLSAVLASSTAVEALVPNTSGGGPGSQELPPHCDWVALDPLGPAAAAEPSCLMPEPPEPEPGSCPEAPDRVRVQYRAEAGGRIATVADTC